MDATYSASAYRSEVNDSLPPPRWKEESNRNGIFDTHLAFGNYANLDPEMEIVGQLSIGLRISQRLEVLRHIATLCVGSFRTLAEFLI